MIDISPTVPINMKKTMATIATPKNSIPMFEIILAKIDFWPQINREISSGVNTTTKIVVP